MNVRNNYLAIFTTVTYSSCWDTSVCRLNPVVRRNPKDDVNSLLKDGCLTVILSIAVFAMDCCCYSFVSCFSGISTNAACVQAKVYWSGRWVLCCIRWFTNISLSRLSFCHLPQSLLI